MSQRTLRDRGAGVERMIRALGREPGEWELDDLALIEKARRALDVVETRAIGGLRAGGVTDGQIAGQLGVTRQAVSKRWPGGGRYVGAAGQYRVSA